MARRSGTAVPRYRDAELDSAERAKDLLARLSLPQKLQQLVGCWPAQLCSEESFDPELAREILTDGIGHISRIGASTGLLPGASAALANAIQQFLVEETEHGIPAIIHEDAIAGYCARGATVFPQAIAQAATFEPRLARRIAAAAAAQMRAVGAQQALGPVLDVARDPRWGRLEETYGEDPYLCGRMGIGFVRGLQGEALTKGVAATAMHFLGYGLPEGGINHAPVQIGPRTLREVYAEPFAAAIREARLASVMHSYSAVDGVPCGGAPGILRELLRDELKFDGVVVADYFGVALLERHHHIAANKTHAAILALRAGLDIELPAKDCFGSEFAEAIAADATLLPLLDDAVGRVLRLKFELGLFESPYVDAAEAGAAFETAEQRALALEVATASMVLLENDGVLPLPAATKIALLGPAADDARTLQGDYHYPAQAELVGGSASSFVPGPEDVALSTPLGALSEQFEVHFAPGCGITPGAGSAGGSELGEIKDAVALTRNCDVALICVGGSSGSLANDTSGAFRDAADLRLTGNQEALIERVLATGKPVVVAVFGGRAFDLSRFADRVNALLYCWLPGAEGGRALAQLVSGAVSPSGRLPVSLVRSVGQVPSYYGHRGGDGRSLAHGDYIDTASTPLYPFGFGRSYSTFSYGPFEGPTAVDVFGVIVVSVVVENTGGCSAAEVVQLYLRDTLADVARPRKALAGFARLQLAAGERKRVQFQLDTSQAAYFNQAMEFVVEPGELLLFVGSSSAHSHGELAVMLEGEKRFLQQHQVISTRVAVTPVAVD
ncbi:MAG: glycoside hydrolase family 3 N-terminal domain-containing protein [Pseudomonadales bacterium]